MSEILDSNAAMILAVMLGGFIIYQASKASGVVSGAYNWVGEEAQNKSDETNSIFWILRGPPTAEWILSDVTNYTTACRFIADKKNQEEYYLVFTDAIIAQSESWLNLVSEYPRILSPPQDGGGDLKPNADRSFTPEGWNQTLVGNSVVYLKIADDKNYNRNNSQIKKVSESLYICANYVQNHASFFDQNTFEYSRWWLSALSPEQIQDMREQQSAASEAASNQADQAAQQGRPCSAAAAARGYCEQT